MRKYRVEGLDIYGDRFEVVVTALECDLADAVKNIEENIVGAKVLNVREIC